MDMETRRDMETMAEWAATQDAWDRLLERRAGRRRSLRFWFSWRQIVDDPASGEHTHRLTITFDPGTAVPAPGAQAQSHTCAPAPPGAGTGAAGFRDVTPTNALTPLASGSRLPGGPPHR